MNKPIFAMGRCIQWMRFARPAIDLGLLVLGLFLFMHFDNIFMKHQTEENKSKRIATALNTPSTRVENPQKPVSIVQQFESENEMWMTFENWLQTTEAESGNCRIETRADLNQTPYSLQCTGSSNTTNTRPGKTASQNILFESNVLVKPEKRFRPTIHEKETHGKHAVAEDDTVPVSGWINTPSGRKHFDPVTQRWHP